MFDRIFKDIFGTETFDKLENAFNETIKDFENENKNDDFSYFHGVKDKYENGKHVSHDEKEVKDGKVVKDIHRSVSIEDKNDDVSNTPKCEANLGENPLVIQNRHLETHLRSAENALKEKDDRISVLEKENKALHEKLDRIKNLF